MKRIKTFTEAVLAGIFISIGGVAFLSLENKVLGALLFAVGLFAICTLKLNLYTGKVCYVFDNNKDYLFNLPVIWLGNLTGTFLTSALLHLTRIFPAIHERAVNLAQIKLNDSLLSILLLSFMCNILIYLAVEEYNLNPHELGKYLGIIFGVVTFIVCGFEHCVANMFYFFTADMFNLNTLLYVLIMTLGNSLGGLFIPFIRKFL